MHTTLDVLHVVTAVFIVGPMAILPMTAMRAMRAGDKRSVASLAKSTNIFSLASLLVVILGFGVLSVSDKKYDLSIGTPWIWISIVLYIIALALNLFVIVPTLAEVAVADSTQDARARGAYQRVAMSSGIATLLLVAVVVLMVAKP